MSQRARARPRCRGCGLKPETCLCATLPRRRFATPLVVVQHAKERFKPTNTGRLLARMVEDCTLLFYGIKGTPFEPGPLADPTIDWRVLYPRKDAALLRPGERPAAERRLGLVLLDGTWNQSARMSRRVPLVADFPCVALPDGPPSIWAVRTQHLAAGRSTFEAAVFALGLLEGDDAVAPLRDAFAKITAALLRLKGKPDQARSISTRASL